MSLEAVRQSTEETFTIRAGIFADCSGDGRLGFEAGADFTLGREAKADYGESLALDTADRQTLGSSIMFTARKYDTPQPFIAPSICSFRSAAQAWRSTPATSSSAMLTAWW